jgi:uncharacterized protein (DUF952 family)
MSTVEQSQVKELAAWYSLLKSRLYRVVQKSKHLTDKEMVYEVRKLTAHFPRVDQILDGNCPIGSEEEGATNE